MIQEPERRNGPPIHEISSLQLPNVAYHHLENGIPVFEITGGDKEVIKLEIVFQAGRPYEKGKMISKAVSYLLKEGTHNFTSEEIANKIDFYGATLKTTTNLDDIRISLYTLKKYFKPLIKLIREILDNATFPEKELNIYKQNSIQNLKIESAKNEFKAYRLITEKVFGKNHPYGYNSSEKLYAQINRDDLLEHFINNCSHQNCKMFISGLVDADILQMLDEELGSFNRNANQTLRLNEEPFIPGKFRTNSVQNHQTAIRFGKKLFNRTHKDYPKVFVLTTILGGYFGSRLMSNLREDKGYTYNISSGIDDFLYGGYLYINADVGNDYVEDSLKEIKNELLCLINEPVSAHELKLVKNYQMGNLMNMLDGPLNQSTIVRSLITKNSDLVQFKDLIDSILTMDAETLQQTATSYFEPDSLSLVTVGKI